MFQFERVQLRAEAESPLRLKMTGYDDCLTRLALAFTFTMCV